MVLALAGDSTMTSFFEPPRARRRVRAPSSGVDASSGLSLVVSVRSVGGIAVGKGER
jgi:hypothetical protein